MAFVWRHAAAIIVVLLALTAMSSVFTYFKPQYSAPYEESAVDLHRQGNYTTIDVMHAFTAQGLPLAYSARDNKSDGKFTWLGFTPPPWAGDDFYVLLAPGGGNFTWKPSRNAYNERVANVVVYYGGDDPYILRAVQDATETLR